MGNARAEEKLQPDPRDAHQAEEHRGEGSADGVGRAEDDGGEAHEAPARRHVLREDVEAAGRELGATDGAENAACRERDEARAGRIGADAARC